jgi:hypothetical protein
MLHHNISHLGRFDFGVIICVNIRLNFLHDSLNGRAGYGTLRAGSLDPSANLLTIKRLTRLIALYDPNTQFFDFFYRRKSALTTVADPLAPHHVPAFSGSRVEHSIIIDVTIRASHRAPEK